MTKKKQQHKTTCFYLAVNRIKVIVKNYVEKLKQISDNM